MLAEELALSPEVPKGAAANSSKLLRTHLIYSTNENCFTEMSFYGLFPVYTALNSRFSNNEPPPPNTDNF